MTITSNEFDPSHFYQQLKEVILEVVQRKVQMFAILKEQPDVIQRRDAMSSILTLFSLSDSVIMSRGFEDGKLHTNIDAMIKDFYDQTGNADVIGVQPGVLVWELLEDLAYSIKPRFKMSDIRSFVNDQPLSEADEGMLSAQEGHSGDNLIYVITALLIVIKAEMILVDVVEAPTSKRKNSD